MKKLKEISTAGMTRGEWLAYRQKSIGGSDAATVVGLNPYSSPYELWADKLGKIPPKEENEAMRIGHDLEEYVAQRFTEATGKKVRRKNAILYDPGLPFAHANVDRLIVGEPAGLECKTTSVLNLKKFRNGEFPAVYYVQCQHYMMVTGYEKWYLAVLVLGREFLWFEIERNDEDIKALKAAEEEFFKLVKNETPPGIDGSKSCGDTLSAIFAESDDEIADLTPFMDELGKRTRLEKQIKELQKLKDEQDNRIKEYMGECGYGECEGYKVSWKTSSRRTFDAKKYATDNSELDLNRYYKISKTRTFRVTKTEE